MCWVEDDRKFKWGQGEMNPITQDISSPFSSLGSWKLGQGQMNSNRQDNSTSFNSLCNYI